MALDVIVNTGVRKTGLQFTVDSSQFGAESSSRLKSPGLEKGKRSVARDICP
jgi:hypothetical protein